MPQYRVTKPGFWSGEYYDPNGKRRVIRTDKPFPSKNKVEQVPSWMVRIKDETAAQKKKREATEAKAAEADAEKALQDQVDTDAVNFIEEPKSTVETLG